MDPKRCLEMLVTAIKEGETEDIRSYASMLREWLEGGGFTPFVSDADLMTILGQLEILK